MNRLDPIRQLLANRPLAALVGAGAISGIGDWIYLTAMPVLVYQRTEDAALVGLAVIGRLIPFFALSVPAGIAADRFPRRAILIASESVRAIAMLLIALLCVAGANIAFMIALTIVAATAGTFSFPAQASLTPELARDDSELGRANAVFATLDSIACVIGPGLAGLLIVVGGLPVAFALNGLSFAAVAIALVVWRPSPRTSAGQPSEGPAAPPASRPEDRPMSWPALVDRIVGPLVLDGAISMASAAMSVLVVFIAVDLLRGGESLTGLLNAGGGLGGILGGVAAGSVINGRSRGGVAVAVLAFAVAMVVLGIAADPLVAFAATTVAVGSITMLDTLNTTTLQRLTADGTTGRAFGILHSLAALWMMAGVVLSSALIATLGIESAVLGIGAVVLVLGGLSVVMRVRDPRPAVEPAGLAASTV